MEERAWLCVEACLDFVGAELGRDDAGMGAAADDTGPKSELPLAKGCAVLLIYPPPSRCERNETL